MNPKYSSPASGLTLDPDFSLDSELSLDPVCLDPGLSLDPELSSLEPGLSFDPGTYLNKAAPYLADL